MEKNRINSINLTTQWCIYLATNIFFVCKYFPRAGFNPVLSAVLYGIIVSCLCFVYQTVIRERLTERVARNLSIIITSGIIIVIGLAIALIPATSLQVDRWSATTTFWDSLFQGIYPYGVKTYGSTNNYPSPFPVWQYLNLPFWAIGDVGWQQAFFLLVFIGAVFYYSRSWLTVLTVLFFIILSPAYWWEVMTRSDGLSNSFLVLSTILFIQRHPIKMSDRWWLLAIIAGLLACTRLSVVIPLALYMFRPWLEADWKIKIGFVAIAFAVAFSVFAPYIFWDTETWIFLEYNPFITQTTHGNVWVLLSLVIIAIIIASIPKSFYNNISISGIYLFAFMLISQIVIVLSLDDAAFFGAHCDISYHTLSLPYCVLALTIRE